MKKEGEEIMARYQSLDDELVRNIMIDEANFRRGKIFAVIMIIGIPIFMSYMFGPNIIIIIQSFFAAVFVSGIYLFKLWLELRSSKNDYETSKKIRL